VGSNKYVQYTLEGRVTAVVVLIQKKGEEKKTLQQKEKEGT
jgi:hypothetical protein